MIKSVATALAGMMFIVGVLSVGISKSEAQVKNPGARLKPSIEMIRIN